MLINKSNKKIRQAIISIVPRMDNTFFVTVYWCTINTPKKISKTVHAVPKKEKKL